MHPYLPETETSNMNTPARAHPLNPLSGFGYFLSGFALITHKKIRPYVFIPLGINIILFAALIYYGYTQMNLLALTFTQRLPDWLSWLHWLLLPIFILSVAMLVFFTFALFANIIAAPFNPLLSAAVEEHLSGKKPPKNTAKDNLFVSILKSVGEEIYKLLYNLSRLIPVLILFLIPLVQLAAPFVMFLLSAWLMALQYADFPMGNHGLSFKEQRELLRGRRLLSLSFGATTLGATLIPGLNLLAMPVAVAGVTKMWVKEFAQQQQ